MKFTLYPAIDIRGGRCVRLKQGDYQQETIYADDPVQVAERFVQEGAEWIHVVDLDGAREGELINLQVIRNMVQATGIPIQVGGGVRDMDRLERLLSIGVDRIIIGSAAIDHPEFVAQALRAYGRRIAIGIDARDGMVATHGWLDTSKISAEKCAIEMANLGAETFIFTDIARDGMLSGVNVEAVAALAKACGREVIASGGVRSLTDIKQLASVSTDGVGGVIIGKALYTHAFQLLEALTVARQEVTGR
ncbi:1-(5-phosphoribosyl)-5-[(5-phosphoribosylamino)methylideneamino] imidazole-4-carboxamide isomerase [Seinonella peptonophila]|uniref:1-(5-phosphoribosyl)-5-[(5-phosphoribosylamino)methylideneamino] imidazole-4-carboxamide isomerase n=1 Tax=Seinonella peptonophila TaxID=112248 RepID=A0A1M4XNE2_9BACL|nr:1-(5-phosphoribosyl)-5-[(5-phosphoribosylamino)methylideneamino]imidazole-4-carboxamide isomerase [Seinonella peptonophila]SHE94951.1 1-(5-phosphoribosyl)-5-[(5-phosphoribosylamino)methylideneamino] imidazole-4-carboxamide isomerase [Seinonella peptonophila]